MAASEQRGITQVLSSYSVLRQRLGKLFESVLPIGRRWIGVRALARFSPCEQRGWGEVTSDVAEFRRVLRAGTYQKGCSSTAMAPLIKVMGTFWYIPLGISSRWPSLVYLLGFS